MVRFTLVTALALAATNTHAFMPATTTTTTGRSTFTGTALSTPTFSTTSSTALQMNLFDRFQRVAKSNLNNILKGLEDPEKIMNQALEDMQVRQKHV